MPARRSNKTFITGGSAEGRKRDRKVCVCIYFVIYLVYEPKLCIYVYVLVRPKREGSVKDREREKERERERVMDKKKDLNCGMTGRENSTQKNIPSVY